MRISGQGRAILVLITTAVMASCSAPQQSNQPVVSGIPRPSEIIDLGTLVTADLPERVWGKAFLRQLGFTKPNSFEVLKWSFPVEGGNLSGSNAYYTLFNHGGPHVDAPSHMTAGGGIDSYPIEAFSGPLKVFDVSGYAGSHRARKHISGSSQCRRHRSSNDSVYASPNRRCTAGSQDAQQRGG